MTTGKPNRIPTNTTTETQRPTPSKTVNGVPLGLVVCLVAVFIIVLVVLGLMLANSNSNALETVDINQMFVDVNGDGRIDLIVKGLVVLNTGQLNFQQPANP